MIYSYSRLMLTRQPVLSDKGSVIKIVKAFEKFSLFSGLRPSRLKWEIADIGASGTLLHGLYRFN